MRKEIGGSSAHEFDEEDLNNFNALGSKTRERLDGENEGMVDRRGNGAVKENEEEVVDSRLKELTVGLKKAQTEVRRLKNEHDLATGKKAEKIMKELSSAEKKLEEEQNSIDTYATEQAKFYNKKQELIATKKRELNAKFGALSEVRNTAEHKKGKKDRDSLAWEIERYESQSEKIENDFQSAGLDLNKYLQKITQSIQEARQKVEDADTTEITEGDVEVISDYNKEENKLVAAIIKGDLDTAASQIQALKTIDSKKTNEEIYKDLVSAEKEMTLKLKESDEKAEEEKSKRGFFAKIFRVKGPAVKESAKIQEDLTALNKNLRDMAINLGLHKPTDEEKEYYQQGSEAALRLDHYSTGGADMATLGAGGTGIGGVESAMTSRSSIAIGERGSSASKKQESSEPQEAKPVQETKVTGQNFARISEAVEDKSVDVEVARRAFDKVLNKIPMEDSHKNALRDLKVQQILAKNGYSGERSILQETFVELSDLTKNNLLRQGFKENTDGTLKYGKWFGRADAEDKIDYQIWSALQDLQNSDVFSGSFAQPNPVAKRAVNQMNAGMKKIG